MQARWACSSQDTKASEVREDFLSILLEQLEQHPQPCLRKHHHVLPSLLRLSLNLNRLARAVSVRADDPERAVARSRNRVSVLGWPPGPRVARFGEDPGDGLEAPKKRARKTENNGFGGSTVSGYSC